jgi:glutamate-1-semialdehyde aminotransferase
MITYLIEHEDEIYPALAIKGERLRRSIEKIFANHGVPAVCTGDGNEAVPGSSLACVHFPLDSQTAVTCPEQVGNPALCDLVLREQVLKLGLLLENVHVMHGLGSVTTAHADADLERVLAAFDRVAQRIAASL